MNHSIAFFDRQFSQGATPDALALNPFEQQALPHLQGEVLDFGCGMGNLAFAAAARGCRVTALDASAAAIAHIRQRAAREAVPVQAAQADLRTYAVDADYDAVVSIGLLMFFDCDTARRVLDDLLRHVRPGGVAAVNVLVEGTTYMAMFEPQSHCLWPTETLPQRFAGWDMLHHELSTFEAPGHTRKRFCTVVARKPH